MTVRVTRRGVNGLGTAGTDMAETDIESLLAIVARLRDPASGCPWDLEQTFASIAPYTLEEAYEVVDAIERGDLGDLKDELGDLLLQVVFHSRMAEEAGAFGFGDVVAAIAAKMLRRHPHVFGERVFGERGPVDAASVRVLWDEAKRAETARRTPPGETRGLLDDVPQALPALVRADKLSRKAASVGFDWPDSRQVIDKVREEIVEVEQALAAADREGVAEEIGDLLFAVANLARHAGIDAESSLRRANRKFGRRFAFLEAAARHAGRTIDGCDLETLEAWWQQAKRAERSASPEDGGPGDQPAVES